MRLPGAPVADSVDNRHRPLLVGCDHHDAVGNVNVQAALVRDQGCVALLEGLQDQGGPADGTHQGKLVALLPEIMLQVHTGLEADGDVVAFVHNLHRPHRAGIGVGMEVGQLSTDDVAERGGEPSCGHDFRERSVWFGHNSSLFERKAVGELYYKMLIRAIDWV